jgi:two-component system sensor histidine kinase FlrB
MEVLLSNANATINISDMSGHCRIAGNRDALLSAIQNLVNNAVEACTGNCDLQLTTEVTFNNGVQGVLLSLKDNGPGIEKAMLEQIFEPFFTTRSRGTGLGLAVVKAVVHAHNGTIWAESEPGNGSTFNIYLPLDRQTSLSSGGNKNIKS